MNYKIIMDYAAQEVKKLEGSKITMPERYDKAVLNFKRARELFVDKVNNFIEQNSESTIVFPVN